MDNQIIFTPDAIRAAGDKISALDVQASYSRFPEPLTSSSGLGAEGVNELIEELKTIEALIQGIVKKLPEKLNKVATTIEQSDKAAAGQYQ